MSSNMNNEDRESTTSKNYSKPVSTLTSSAATRKPHKNETTYDASEKSSQQSTTKSDNQQKFSNPPIGTGKAYIGKGMKLTIHGFSYQMKLSMLYVVRGLKKECAFQIATEVGAVDKFDDILFLHEKDEIAFFQAKHRRMKHNKKNKINEDSKITEQHLLSDEGDFSIPRYFHAYKNILNDKRLEDDIKGRKMIFILNTNIDIDESVKKSFEPVTNSAILALGTNEQQKNCYSIRKDSDLYDKLEKILTMLEPPKRVAERLAIEVANYKNKCIQTKDLLDGHRDWLLDNVLEVSKEHIKTETKYFVTFRDSFLNGSEQNESNFQEIFYKKYLEQTKQTDLTRDLLDVKFQVPRSFASPKNSEVKNVQDSTCTFSFMKTFLDMLVFAVKQPNEIELGDLVEKEICSMGYDDGKSIANKFKLYIQDWAEQSEGRYLKNEDVDRQLAVWEYETLNKIRMKDVKKYKCAFKESNEVIKSLSKFLNTINDAHTMLDVFCLYCTETLFSKIKVCQVFDSCSLEIQQIILCDIRDLIEYKTTKKCPLKAFSSQTCNTLFVSLQDYELNDAEVQILIRLLKIIAESNYNVEQPLSNKQRKRLIMAIPENLKSKFANYNFFKNQKIKSLHLDDLSNSFGDLDDKSRQYLIKNGSVKINGKQVTGLFSENELDLCIKDEILLKFVSNELEVIKGLVEQNQYLEEVKPYYVARYLSPATVNPRITEDIRFHIVRRCRPHEHIGNKEVVVISSNEKLFDDICSTNTNVHWLKLIHEKSGKKYVWMASKGILTNLRKYVEVSPDCESSIAVTNVSSMKNDIVIITASPGMGKSTLLSHIAEQSTNEDNSFVVFKTNLTSTIDKLESLNAEESTTLEQAIHFLFISTQIESSEIEESESAFRLLTLQEDGSIAISPDTGVGPLEKFLAMVFCNLYNKEKNVLLLDGFDEIAPNYCNTTLNLLMTLKQSKVRKMWVTTRPYVITKDLEICLETFACTMKPLSKKDQSIFFENFWKRNYNWRHTEIQPTVKDFLKTLDMSTIFDKTDGGSGSFMGVPLHCYIVAKVFAKDFTKFCSQNFAEAPTATSIRICDLYSKFFDIKFDEILYSEVDLKNPKNTEIKKKKKMVESDCGKLALLTIFGEELPCELVSDEERIALINRVKSGKEKTGFVTEVVGNIPQFVHRTLAEYFAAHYLAKVLTSKSENKNKAKVAARSLLYKNFTFVHTEDYYSLFTFFNSIVVSTNKNKDIFEAAIHGNIKILSETENVNEIFDPLQRTPMHLIAIDLLNVLDKFLSLCVEADLETTATMLKYFNNFIQRLSESMSKCSPDILFFWTPAHYMTISFHMGFTGLKIIPFLVNYLSDITRDTSCRTPLKLLILRNSVIHDAFKDYELSNGIDVNTQDEFGKTALHYLLEKYYGHGKDNMSNICLLLKLGARIDIPDKTGTTSEDRINNLLADILTRYDNKTMIELPSCNIDDVFKKSWNLINKHVKEYMCASEEFDDLLVSISSDTFDKTEPTFKKNQLKRYLFYHFNNQNNTPILPVPNSQVIALYYMDVYFQRERFRDQERQNLIAKKDIFTMSNLNDDEIIFLLIETKHVASILLSKFPHFVNVVDSRGRSALHYAFFKEDNSKVTLLIESNARVDKPDSAGKVPAYIEKSNVLLKCDTFDKRKLNFIDTLTFEVVERLVRTVSLYSIQTQIDIDFIVHVLCNTECIANVLLSHYPEAVDTKDSKGKTALHYAVENRNKTCVNYLIQSNANVFIVDNAGKVPAHIEKLNILKGNSTSDKETLYFIDTLTLKVAERLVRTMSLYPIQTQVDVDFVIHVLCNTECIAKVLLSHYPEAVDTKDSKGKTALHYAVENRNKTSVNYLIQCNASVDIVDNAGKVPAYIEKSNVLLECDTFDKRKLNFIDTLTFEVAERLVWTMNLYPIQTQIDAKFIIHILLLCVKTIANVLLSKYPDVVNTQDSKGKTALHYAVENRNKPCVTYLIQSNANVFIVDNAGKVPAHIEKLNVLKGKNTSDKETLYFINTLTFEVAECLVRTMNLYPIQTQIDAEFIIHILLLCTKTIANVLLSKYPDAVNTQDSKGRTALHYAVEKKNRKSVSYLIDKNAKVNIVDNEDKCPAHLIDDVYTRLTFIDTLPYVLAKPLVFTMVFDSEQLKYIFDKCHTIASILSAEYTNLFVNHNCLNFISSNVGNEIVSRLLNIYCVEDLCVQNVKSNEILPLVAELFNSVQNNDLSRVQTVLKRVETYNPKKYKTLTRKSNVPKNLIFHWGCEPGLFDFSDCRKFPLLRSTLSIRCDETNKAIAMVNARSDKDGKTALHYAAEIGNADIVEALLSHGAYYNVPDSHGSTPLQIAETQTHSAVVHLLERVEKLFNCLNDEEFCWIWTEKYDDFGFDMPVCKYPCVFPREYFIQKNEPEIVEDKFVGMFVIQDLGVEFLEYLSSERSLIKKIHKVMMNNGDTE